MHNLNALVYWNRVGATVKEALIAGSIWNKVNQKTIVIASFILWFILHLNCLNGVVCSVIVCLANELIDLCN